MTRGRPRVPVECQKSIEPAKFPIDSGAVRTPAEPETARAPSSRPSLVYANVIVAGASVMVVEILGTRVLRPFFGVSLFVWSSLLAVTLASLAVGYFAGGVLVDRRPERRVLYWLVLGAGVTCGLLPWLSAPVLGIADAAGLRLGAIISASLLFAPTLTLLGMVSPAALRLLTREVREVGHRTGWVYGLSTLGGLVATLLTGFVLVPAFDVDAIFTGVALLLILAGLTGLVEERTRPLVGLLLVVPFAARLGEDPSVPGIRTIERSQSPYGVVSVVQDERRASPLRLLRVDHSFMGAEWVETGESAFSFVHLFEAVRLARPEGQTALFVGLGTGAAPKSFARRAIRADVVEIDPEVVRYARQYFGYVPNGDVAIEDARTFLRRTERRYDFIVHDTFTGGETPEHLLSVEVLERVQALLQPGGVLVLNVVGGTHGELSLLHAAVNRTVRHVFPHVRAFRDAPDREGHGGLSNVVYFASEEPLEFAPAEPPYESPSCEQVLTHFREWEVPAPAEGTTSAPLITDARNPLARLSLPVSEAFSEAMRQMYPKEFWLQ